MLNVKDCSIADSQFQGVVAVEIASDEPDPPGAHPKSCDNIFKTRSQHHAEIAMARQLLSAVFQAATDKDLEQSALFFLRDLCHHFALLFCMGKGRQHTHTMPSRAELPPTLFLDVIIDNMCSPDEPPNGKTARAEVAVQVRRLHL